MPMIEIDRLRKRFGPFTAVDGVTFQVERGEVLGFLGPNGAGKSTTMKMAAGFLAPTEGSVRICGHDVADAPLEAKRMLGYLPEGAPGYGDMTPRGFLGFIADIRRLKGAARRQAIDRVIDQVEIEGVLEQPIDTLSKGFKRRVGVAQAILHDPQVLILDEPTDGLDPNQKHEVRNLIRRMGTDKAIVISTHILEEVEAVCTRAMIIDRGRIVADGTPVLLAESSVLHNAVSLRLKRPVADAGDALAALARVERVEVDERLPPGIGWTVYPRDRASIIADVGELARLQGWQVDRLNTESGRLDDVFRRLTTRDTVLLAAKPAGAAEPTPGVAP